MEESLRKRYTLPRSRRLIKTADYGAVLSSGTKRVYRCSTKWLALTALLQTTPLPQTGLRFGFTVGKLNAHRGVDRVLIKRILRESARHQQHELRYEHVSLDVILRLRRKIPSLGKDISLKTFKKELRSDCDQLLQSFFLKFSQRNISVEK
ncbi:ribonuclease P protein component [Mesosutterella sp. AGMB02718]|uniref:Ribonuclease P protein component n=1 Tax=Mesosutterella faecium TaxID=2925194 RepID=A0ABT7IKE2_9BURK|nr:ribonuclease P protein component [Mesosutterella sp. AGMB02718]MDL2058840.1 ribonuclease P protein component [Mesosutterella sp. AGMB02718]